MWRLCMSLLLVSAWACCWSQLACGQQLVANGDFEIQAFDVNNNPIVDGQGNFRPSDWFYADSSPPNPIVTEWVEGEDSDGMGTHAAAIYRVNADWRSLDYEVIDGETLQVSYDFKFVGVSLLDGFRADVRFFEFPGAGAGFAGETVKGYAVEISIRAASWTTAWSWLVSLGTANCRMTSGIRRDTTYSSSRPRVRPLFW